MLVTLQLDQCTLPETGQVELNIQRLFEINVSANEARRIVNRWFRNEVTMSFMAEMPTLIIDKANSKK